MQVLGPSTPAPSKEELIQQLTDPLMKVVQDDTEDESVDRTWILRRIHKAQIYYRDLQYFAPQLYQGLIDATGIDGTLFPDTYASGGGVYDYSQKRRGCHRHSHPELRCCPE